MPSRPHIIRIAGKAWRIEYAPIGDWGHCEYGSCRRTRRIRINPNQSDGDLLDTLIHEMLHAQDWALSEDAVGPRATEIKTAILRLFDVTRKTRAVRKPRSRADE